MAYIVLGWAAFVGMMQPPPPSLPTPAPVAQSSLTENPPALTGYVSAYSCDKNVANRMYPCGNFRDGSRPSPDLHGVVAACPYEWLGDLVTVEGYGTVRCTDTPRNGWVGGKPHIDLFMSYPAALNWGIREIAVYPAR